MRVLLIQPRFTLEHDIPLVVQPPLGLCYLAAVAREAGHEPTVLDCLAAGWDRVRRQGSRATYGIDDDEAVGRATRLRPAVIGISVPFTIQYPNARSLCQRLRAALPDATIVMGGMHATVDPAGVLACDAVDYVVRGEAEHSFTSLLGLIERGEDVTAVDGLCYRDPRGVPVIRGKERFIEDLDALPFPAWDLLDLPRYWRAGLVHGFNLRGRRSLPLVSSRGCPALCSFCTIHSAWGRRFRARSPADILEEIDLLERRFGVDHLQFEDDNLTYDMPRAKELFRGMACREKAIPWNTPNGVALWRMDRECLDLMSAAGCYYVSFGLESASQRVLTDLIRKPLDLSRVLPLIPYARGLGMKVCLFFVVGTPGERQDELQASFDLPYRVAVDWVEYSVATPYRGTALLDEVLDAGQLREDRAALPYARRASIDTPEFTAEWLEDMIRAENRRYIRYLLRRRPRTFFSQGWQVVRVNPRFVFTYLRRLFLGS